MEAKLESLVGQLLTEVTYLRQQVASQRTELDQLKTVPVASPVVAPVKVSGSRRQMLKQLAGLATGAVALSAFGTSVSRADDGGKSPGAVGPTASGGSMIIGQSNAPGTTAGTIDITYLTNPALSVLATALFVANNRSSGGSNTTAFSVSQSYRAGLVGITSGVDTVTVPPSPPRTGVFGGVDGAGYGLVGYASDPTTGVGGYFSGPNAALAFGASSNTAGQPTTGPHSIGSVYVDGNFSLYYCVAGSGVGGTYRKLAGVETAGSLHLLPTPVRIVDTLNGTALNAAGQPLNGFGAITGGNVAGVNANTRPFNATGGTSSIPPTAVAVTGYLYVYPGYKRFTPKPGYGYLTVWKQGAAYPLASQTEGITSLVYLNSTVASSAFTVALSAGGQLNTAASVTTHLVIDITGYYL